MLDLEDNLERYKFFRDVQVWPDADALNYNGWLSNFETINDRRLAYKLLNFFNYYPKKMVDQMLASAVGQAGFKLSKSFPDWKHSHFMDKCFYSFIPGETQNPSDSGNLFMRKLRDHLGIRQDRFIDYSNLHDFLERATEKLPIVLVDDFVGSGSQCYKAWNKNIAGGSGHTLMEISMLKGHKFVYCPLIVNLNGYEIINNFCDGLILSPAHILGREYNIFNKECVCWKEDNKSLYDEGVEMILRISNRLGVPFSNGKSVKDVRGFGEQGLAIAFEHGAPDAVPPIFYWSDNWIPLINKRYER